MEPIIKKTPRIESIDALRGFAVMAILLVHSLEHFIFPIYPTNSPQWLNILDEGVFNVTFSLFAGKAYAIFAILFGFTFYIQSENQKRKGKDFGYRFLWRLLLLVAFATLNAAFFPAGDVLLLFSIVGVVLFIARNWNNKTILIVAILFLLQPVEWYHYVMGLINTDYQLPNLGVGEMYAVVAESTKNNSLLDFFWVNITLGQKASLYWAVGAGRYLQTAGLFLLGFYLGRKEFFLPTLQNTKFWVRVLICSAVAFGPLYSLKEQITTTDVTLIKQTVGTVFDMWQKLAFTLVLVSSFILIYQKNSSKKIFTDFKFYGRMSLTNYITQSIIGALIYFPIGLYLAPYCGYTLSLFIGILMCVVQVKFCKWWLSSHKQGPLEYVWHKWTWIRKG